MTHGKDLSRVAREGRRIRTEHLEVRAVASPLGHPRIGVIVPKHRHTAVERNTLKRRLREIARLRLLPMLPSIDVVIRAGPRAYRLPADRLEETVVTATGRVSALVQQQSPRGPEEGRATGPDHSPSPAPG